MPLILRNVKGGKLTYDELDGNFLYLENAIIEVADNSSSSDIVRVTEQDFYNANQQNQARENINAADKRLNDIPNDLSVEETDAIKSKLNIETPDFNGYVVNPVYDLGTFTLTLGIVGEGDLTITFPFDQINESLALIPTQAILENAIVNYKNADDETVFDVDCTEMIDDNYIRGNMTNQEKEAFRFKIDAISAYSMNDYLKVIGTNYVANCNIAPLGHSYVNPSTANMPDVDDLYGRLIVTSTNNSWIIQELQATNGMFFRRISTNAGISFFSWTQFDPYSYARINGSNIPSSTVWSNLTAGNSNALGGFAYVNEVAPDFDLVMVSHNGLWQVVTKAYLASLFTPTGSTSVILTGGSYQRAALTGDVTAAQNSNTTTISNNAITTSKILDTSVTSGKLATDSVITAKIQNNAVTNDKAADMPPLAIKGNNTGSLSDPKDLTVSQVREMLGINNLEYKTEFRTFNGSANIDTGNFNQYIAVLVSPNGNPSTYNIASSEVHGQNLSLLIAPGSQCTINIKFRIPSGAQFTSFVTTDGNATYDFVYDKNDDIYYFIGRKSSGM